MKKIISITILVLCCCFPIYFFLWKATIFPMIEMYKLYGIKGSIIYFLCEICILGILYFIFKFIDPVIDWAINNLFEKMATQKQHDDAYSKLLKWESEVCEHNNIILSEFKVNEDDFTDLLSDCNITGKIEIVKEPQGTEQTEEEYGNLTITHIEQWTTGIEGDSYAGFIYAKIKSIELWLKIPYSC